MDVTINNDFLGYDTYHCFLRAKERAGLSRKRALGQINLARERGIRSDDCRWSQDKKYLISRTNGENEAVAFNGMCFIFDRKTGGCITLYKLPKHFGKKKVFYNKSEK